MVRTNNLNYAVPRSQVGSPYSTPYGQQPQPQRQTTSGRPYGSSGPVYGGQGDGSRPSGITTGNNPYGGASSYGGYGASTEAQQATQILALLMQPNARQLFEKAGQAMPSVGRGDLEGLLLSGAQIPPGGTLEYETEKGTTLQLSAAQLRKLQSALQTGKSAEVELKDSRGDKYKLKLDIKVDKKTGEIKKLELKEEKSKGLFKKIITSPLTAAKKVGGWLKDNWKTALMVVGMAAFIIATAGAGSAFAPAMMAVANGANVALGAVNVYQGVRDGNWTQAIMGGVGAYAGYYGMTSPGSSAAANANRIAQGTRTGIGAVQAAKNKNWMTAVGLAANFGGWVASEYNTPLSGSANTLNQISRGASVMQNVNAARRGNLDAMIGLGQSVSQNGWRNTFDPRATPPTRYPAGYDDGGIAANDRIFRNQQNNVGMFSGRTSPSAQPNSARNFTNTPNLNPGGGGSAGFDDGGIRANDLIIRNGGGVNG